ncbi:MAG TPA: ShlB/FhaC/HecB family hemolysin secretion/activation protein [Steroidobacteraceae bacterium]|nr:ShlB/FhaC/HecB family hemolysin secretion/activation protein [Steroidobacteraceae bacterium]
MKKNIFGLPLLFALSLLTTQVWAQVSPDAGSVRQEIEKSRPENDVQKKQPPEITANGNTAAQVDKGPTITVTSFHFSGNVLLTTAQLNAAVAGYLNRPIDFSELQKAAIAVAEAYRKAGWIVRAYLPVQTIGSGVVNIAIVEAVYGRTRLEGDPPTHIAFDRLESIVGKQQRPGAPLNSNRLDRALLLISDLPGIAASGNLAAGKAERETDLVLRVQDQSLFSGNVTVDNTGSRFTGEVRASATLFANSLFHIGDQTSLTYLRAQGINYGQLSATAPIGSNGWRVGPHASYLKYDLVASEFSSLDVHGNSTSYGLDASYPLIRARSKNLYFTAALDSSRFNNLAGNVTTTKYKVSTIELGLKGHRFDSLGGGGINSAMLNVVTGKADLGGSPNEAADAATTKVHGSFTKLRYFFSRQQQLTDASSLYVGVNGQIATKNLDSSEKFYLGGASGVRAYPASEAGGDQGMIANVEGRFRLPRNFSVTGFYDWGNITVNHDNSFIGASTKNSYNLQGVGVSAGWLSDFGLSVKATWAHRVGDNPRATVTGMDQDGSLKKNRFWLQASMSF